MTLIYLNTLLSKAWKLPDIDKLELQSCGQGEYGIIAVRRRRVPS